MNFKLNCPVCGYQEVAGNTCPNCDTDLSVIQMLQELPSVETLLHPVKIATFPLGIALLMLMIGICLGAGGSFIFQQPQLHTLTVSSSHPVATSPPAIRNTPVVVKTPPKLTTYTVKSGDYLSAIAEKFCGKGTSWQVMLQANPQLKGRENYINVGEVLKIPNCKEQAG
jgi:hypothetical protein